MPIDANPHTEHEDPLPERRMGPGFIAYGTDRQCVMHVAFRGQRAPDDNESLTTVNAIRCDSTKTNCYVVYGRPFMICDFHALELDLMDEP
jgi:hypothetical protein